MLGRIGWHLASYAKSDKYQLFENSGSVCKLFLFNKNTWYHIIVCIFWVRLTCQQKGVNEEVIIFCLKIFV